MTFQVGPGILAQMQARGDAPIATSVFVNVAGVNIEIGQGAKGRYLGQNWGGNWTYAFDPAMVPTPAPAGAWYDKVFSRARETFGLTPYSFGGDRVEGRSAGPWDCIGWVMECFDAAGIDLDPGHTQAFTNAERARLACLPIAAADAQPGDLIFFQNTYPTSGASHVGIVWDPVAHMMADDHQRPDGTGPGLTDYHEPYWVTHLLDFRRVRR